MARLCIRIAPNSHPTDKSLDALRTQPGDVVEIREDGHEWSKAELNCGQYKFVDVPGVPESEFTYLKEHVEDADGNMVARRKVKLDEKKLDKTAMSKADVVAMTKVKG